jgi:hypothetical protein
MANLEEQKKVTCPLCKCTFPNKEFYDSHLYTHAKMITNDFFEEFPNFIDFILKIDESKSKEKNIERQIEFLKERQQREAAFIEEQQRHEVEFTQEQERREVERKKKDRELAYIMSTNETPSAEVWKRLFSED